MKTIIACGCLLVGVTVFLVSKEQQMELRRIPKALAKPVGTCIPPRGGMEGLRCAADGVIEMDDFDSYHGPLCYDVERNRYSDCDTHQELRLTH